MESSVFQNSSGTSVSAIVDDIEIHSLIFDSIILVAKTIHAVLKNLISSSVSTFCA